jgi:hypothetical protein
MFNSIRTARTGDDKRFADDILFVAPRLRQTYVCALNDKYSS